MDRNRAGAAAIALAVAATLGLTWYDSPARRTEHIQSRVAVPRAEAGGPAPAAIVERWRAPDAGLAPAGGDAGALLATDERGVRALDPASGRLLWSYARDIELCTAMVAQRRAVAVFRGPAGCGEVTSLDLADGAYHATRRSLAAGEVAPLGSPTRSGVRSARLAELWRGDLVRTVEFGRPEAPAEPGVQPLPECAVVDGITREDRLAVLADCSGRTRLVLMGADPESSREPEPDADVALPGPAALVAVSPGRVALAEGGDLVLRDDAGAELRRTRLEAPAEPAAPGRVPARPATAELGGRTQWFGGGALVVLDQPDLVERLRVPGALGTGDRRGDRLLVPVPGGIAVTAWDGAVERVIPVDRGADPGRVDLRVFGDVIVEWRAGAVVGLAPAPPDRRPAPPPA